MFPILSRPQFTFQLERDELNPLLKVAVFLLGCRFENKDLQQEKVLYQHFLTLSNDFITIPDITTVQVNEKPPSCLHYKLTPFFLYIYRQLLSCAGIPILQVIW